MNDGLYGFPVGDARVRRLTVPYLHYRHQENTTVHAGGSTGGSYQTRKLTHEVKDTAGIGSLDVVTFQITIPGGKYKCLALVPFVNVGQCTSKLINVTDGNALLLKGTANFSGSGGADGVGLHSIIVGEFELTGTKAIAIQSFCGVSVATFGNGYATSDGEVEVYTTIELEKLP